jgi:hypothetical protein
MNELPPLSSAFAGFIVWVIGLITSHKVFDLLCVYSAVQVWAGYHTAEELRLLSAKIEERSYETDAPPDMWSLAKVMRLVVRQEINTFQGAITGAAWFAYWFHIFEWN